MSAHGCIGNPCLICYPQLSTNRRGIVDEYETQFSTKVPPLPAPPSALSGVSAEELRELSYRVRGYRGGNTCGASERIASILRALAESMEGGKG